MSRLSMGVRSLLVALVAMVVALGLGQGTASAAENVARDAVGQVMRYTHGAGSHGKVPTTPQVLPDGGIVEYIDYSADPMAMPTSAQEGADKLVAVTTPDETGVCRLGGYSLGSIAAMRASQNLDRDLCPEIALELSGSPNGPGSLAEILPDIPGVIDFNEGDYPQGADITVTNMRNDGFASCKNQLSSLVTCTVGAFAGHYCAFEDRVPGQCYSSFDGEWLEYSVDGVHYRTADTRNPVAVAVEYVGKGIDPNFALSADQDAQFEAVFPQGMPGIEAEGITLRDVFQPDLPQIAEDLNIETPYVDPAEVKAGVQMTGTVASTVAAIAAPEAAPAIAAATPVVAEVAATAAEVYNNAFDTVAPVQDQGYAAPVGGLNDLVQGANDLAGSITAAANSLGGGAAAPSMAFDAGNIVNDINTAATSLLGGFQLP